MVYLVVLLYTRWMTASAILDFNTVATADKFGNISVVGVQLFLYMNGWGYLLRLLADTATT